jgi:uncharacterized protein (TIGR02453 family)
MNLEALSQFLIELQHNNSKPWFDANRARYQTLRLEFIDLLGEIINGLGRSDSGVTGVVPKDCVFRINRDVRFSNNKDPYKTNFSAAISPGGRHSSLPLYYLQLGAEGPGGGSMVAGGLYFPEPPQLASIRTFIARHPKDAEALLVDTTLLEAFGGLGTEGVLSRLPKGFSEGPDLLRYKSFTVGASLDLDGLDGPTLVGQVVSRCEQMRPLHAWLRRAVT